MQKPEVPEAMQADFKVGILAVHLPEFSGSVKPDELRSWISSALDWADKCGPVVLRTSEAVAKWMFDNGFAELFVDVVLSDSPFVTNEGEELVPIVSGNMDPPWSDVVDKALESQDEMKGLFG